MKLTSNYEGYCMVKIGTEYVFEQQWNNYKLYCVYIIYNFNDNIIYLYNNDTKSKLVNIYFYDILSIIDEEDIYISKNRNYILIMKLCQNKCDDIILEEEICNNNTININNLEA